MRQFGATFGLLAGARLGLAGAYKWLDKDPPAAVRLAKAAAVALVALALVLSVTGGRWSSMFDGVGGAGAVLVMAWLVMTYVLTRIIEARDGRQGEAPA